MSKKIQSVERALGILEYVVRCGTQVGLSEISVAMGLHRSTTYNLVQSLAEEGYLAQQNRRDKYAAGPKLIEIAANVLKSINLRDLARPYLEELHSRCNETVHLSVQSGADALDVDAIQSSQSVRLVVEIGHRMPLHCSAVGKVLLTGLSPEQLDDFFKRRELKRYTQNTITDPQALARELDEIRRTGIAFNRAEFEDGVRCVAAAVFNNLGEVVAGVSISCPEGRFTSKRLPELIRALKDATSKMSARLGHRQ